MALRTRRISFILHLSEVRLTIRPVISIDMDGLCCIPIDLIGFHSTNRYRRIQSDNISALSDFHLTSGTFFASNVSYFLWKVLRIEFCQFHRKTTFPIGVYWKCTAKRLTSIFFFFFFSFFCNYLGQRKTTQKIR